MLLPIGILRQLTWEALPRELLLSARLGLLCLLLLYGASDRKVIATECRPAANDGRVAVHHGLLRGRELRTHRRRRRLRGEWMRRLRRGRKLRLRRHAIRTREGGGSIVRGRWRRPPLLRIRVIERVRVQPANSVDHETDEVVLAHWSESERRNILR